MQKSPDLWPYIHLKQVAFIYEIYAFWSTFPAFSARNFTVFNSNKKFAEVALEKSSSASLSRKTSIIDFPVKWNVTE